MYASPSADRERVGVYGKIPAQGDFVRINAADAAAQSLDQWVQESLDAMQRVGVELPPGPTFFMHHRLDPSMPVTVGAMCPSRDRVGRVYPMIVFVRVDPAWVGSRFPGVAVGYGHFLRGAARILGDLARADAQLLSAWAKQLRAPTAQELAAADQVCRQSLDGIPAASVHARLFGDPSLGLRYHAFRTAIEACDAARSMASRVPITLDCPLRADVDLFTWLELTRRRLYGSGLVPTVVWREEADPRAMISLGPAHPSMLKFLARPAEPANALWPLRTDRPDVVAQSAAALAPHHRQALDRFDLSLEVLLSVLSR